MDEESIPAPPDTAYRSYDEAYAALKEHGIRYGYGFRISASRPASSSTKTRIYFCCDKYREYNSQATIRSTSSRASGCPFKLVIHQKDDQWKLRVTNDRHNHGTSLNPSAHHVYRRRTPAQKQMIDSLSKSGVAPKHVLTQIRQDDPATFIKPQDIRNEKHSAQLNFLNGRSSIEALLDNLCSPDWISDVTLDPEDHVQRLFFAHKKQVELLRANPDVVMMDCTYRTNRYGLPLLHILGSTSLGIPPPSSLVLAHHF
jgi:hypothetical protein